MNDKVTVVTVTYNAEDLLEKTILSVINQSYDNIEYIVIDGASTDGTLDIIKKYQDKIDYWISEADEGIYFAMNKAIEKATGKLINFMNAGDTFFDNETVAYVMKHKREDAELIYGDFIKKKANIIVKAQDQINWYKTMPLCHQTLFTKMNLMKQNPFDTTFKIVADHNFILTMHQKQKKFHYLDHTLAIFDEGGFANRNTVKMCIESIKVLIDHQVGLENIYLTSWYKYLFSTDNALPALQHKYNIDIEIANQKFDSLQHKYNIDTSNAQKKFDSLQHKYNIDTSNAQKKLDDIYSLISNLFSTKLYINPLQKLKAYRRLYLLYKSSFK